MTTDARRQCVSFIQGTPLTARCSHLHVVLVSDFQMKFVGIFLVAFVFLWTLSEVAHVSQAWWVKAKPQCSAIQSKFWRRECWGKRGITGDHGGTDDDVGVPEQFQCCVRPRGRRLRGLDGWKGAKVQGVALG